MEERYKLNLGDIAKEIYEVINSDLAKDDKFKEKKSVREDRIKKIDEEIQACEKQKSEGNGLNQKIWEDLVINMDNNIKNLESKKEKIKEELKEFEKIEKIHENSLKKAEERYNYIQEKIEKEQKRLEEEKDKKTDELFEKKKKYGIKIPDDTHGYTYRYTKEEKIVVEKIENEMNAIEEQYDSKIVDFQTQLDENEIIFNKFRLALKIEDKLKEFIDEENTKSEPAKPEPVKPEPVKPEPAKPEPVKPEPAKPEPVKPEPAKPEPVKPEPVKSEPTKHEPAKSEPVKTAEEEAYEELKKLYENETDPVQKASYKAVLDTMEEELNKKEKEIKNEITNNRITDIQSININAENAKMYINSDKDNPIPIYYVEDRNPSVEDCVKSAFEDEMNFDDEEKATRKYMEYQYADPNIVEVLSNDKEKLNNYAKALNGEISKKDFSKIIKLEYDIRKLAKSDMTPDEKSALKEYAFIHRNIAKVRKTPFQAIEFAFRGLLQRVRNVKALPPANVIKGDSEISDEVIEKFANKSIEINKEAEKFFDKKEKTASEKTETIITKKAKINKTSYDDIISFGEKYKVDNSDNHIEQVATKVKEQPDWGGHLLTDEEIQKKGEIDCREEK